MLPPIADDEAIVRAAERTVRRILRGQNIGYTRDDLLQEGRIAVWLARGAARVRHASTPAAGRRCPPATCAAAG